MRETFNFLSKYIVNVKKEDMVCAPRTLQDVRYY